MHVLRLRREAAFASGIAEANSHHFRIAGLVTAVFGIAALSAGLTLQAPSASAVPSYARQTGQPCATCHTAFPELTPYGRQFKLMGYTSGGTRCGDGSARSNEQQVPLSGMAWPATFTSVKNKVNQGQLGAAPNINDNDWLPGQFSAFVAGQLYCDVGSFAQMTYDRPGNVFSWDNTDIRYAKTGVINGTNIVYGITANNNPTVQDVWNTTPAWSFPFISSEVAPSPAAGTMLGATGWAGQVGGVGGYVWINNMFYAEFTAYGALPPQTLIALGGDPTASRFNGAAPYWRLAAEKTWDKNSFMIGTFGMYAEVQPVGGGAFPDSLTFSPGVTNPFLDIGFDAQYQWIGEEHIFTARASYIWEHQKYSAQSLAAGIASNPTDQLNDFKISASYIYDRTYSFTAGYFSTWGTADSSLYANSFNFSPNSSGWNFDLAYLPFSKGGPDLWPWFNARIGLQYTHYDKFDGSSSFVDFNAVQPLNLKASGNDTVFFYTWLMF
jgi:hypothetical protein